QGDRFRVGDGGDERGDAAVVDVLERPVDVLELLVDVARVARVDLVQVADARPDRRQVQVVHAVHGLGSGEVRVNEAVAGIGHGEDAPVLAGGAGGGANVREVLGEPDVVGAGELDAGIIAGAEQPLRAVPLQVVGEQPFGRAALTVVDGVHRGD